MSWRIGRWLAGLKEQGAEKPRPLETIGSVEACGATNPPFICQVYKGHAGDHVWSVLPRENRKTGAYIEYGPGDPIPVPPTKPSEFAQILTSLAALNANYKAAFEKLADIARTNGLILEALGTHAAGDTLFGYMKQLERRSAEQNKSIDELTAALANAIVFVPVGEAKKIKARHAKRSAK